MTAVECGSSGRQTSNNKAKHAIIKNTLPNSRKN